MPATPPDYDRTAAVFRALSHPIRWRILAALSEPDAELSPKVITDQLVDVALGTVAYHVQGLAANGLIIKTRTQPRRGAVENFWRLAPHVDGRKLLRLGEQALEATGG